MKTGPQKTANLVPILIVAVLLGAIGTYVLLREEVYWLSSKKSNSESSYRKYLDMWPSGKYSEQATALVDASMWITAKQENTLDSFRVYLKEKPNGAHVVEAGENIEALIWKDTLLRNTEEAFISYLDSFPDGNHIREAKNKIEVLDWQKAVSVRTVRSINDFVAKYPKSPINVLANAKIEEIQWEEASKSGSVEAIEDYIKQHPESKYIQHAKSILDTRDWKNAIYANTVDSYETYIQKHRDGFYVSLAESKILPLLWEQAVLSDTAQAFEKYVSEHIRRHGAERIRLVEFIKRYPKSHLAEAVAKEILRIVSDDHPTLTSSRIMKTAEDALRLVKAIEAGEPYVVAFGPGVLKHDSPNHWKFDLRYVELAGQKDEVGYSLGIFDIYGDHWSRAGGERTTAIDAFGTAKISTWFSGKGLSVATVSGMWGKLDILLE